MQTLVAYLEELAILTNAYRLKEEKRKWLALAKQPDEIPPLFGGGDPTKAPLPEESLLEPDEARVLQRLTGADSSFGALRLATQGRLHAIQSSLEFKIDHLADNVHKLDQRVATASREADVVLGRSAARLKEREGKEKGAVGTRDLPTMEVLRSLGRILPEGGG